MTVELFAICYNEERILPFFFDHYKRFVDKITIFDNESTDNSRNIISSVRDLPVDLKNYATNNTLDDSVYLNIKNNCWRDSLCDYVIVVDCDEFVYHPNIKKFLSDTQALAYKPNGYNMVSEKFPTDCPLYDTVTLGQSCNNYSKISLFSPSLTDINYSLGCHTANPRKNNDHVSIVSDENLKLLHYKNLSFDYRWERHQLYNKRFSDFNKKTGAGYHYDFDHQTQLNEFQNLLKNASEIL